MADHCQLSDKIIEVSFKSFRTFFISYCGQGILSQQTPPWEDQLSETLPLDWAASQPFGHTVGSDPNDSREPYGERSAVGGVPELRHGAQLLSRGGGVRVTSNLISAAWEIFMFFTVTNLGNVSNSE